MSISVTFPLVLLAMMGESCAQTRCSNGMGDYFNIGEVECVLLTPYYSEDQWATCLTDSYVRRVSDQNHFCRGGAATCWYQCQVEVNDMDSGPVNDNCRCSDAETPTTPAVETPTLPPECFSPGGLDCNWYRNCLEVRYPCDGTADGYAIEYALKYCNLYSDNYNDFSPAGRLWVDGVRKCLQLALVPSLRPFMHTTCADLKRNALRSHSGCYITPASGAPSICNIPCLDSWKAFWIVNGVGGAFFSAPAETGKQMLDVLVGCTFSTDCTRVGLRTLTFAIPGLRIARSFSHTALTVSQYIAEYFNFDNNRIGWFPYFDDNDSSPDNERRRRRSLITPHSSSDDGSIVLLLVDLQLLNISNGTSAPTVNPGHQTLQETITAFGEAVGNGVLSRIPVTFNNTEVIYGVASVGECGDTLCSNNTIVTELATAPLPTVATFSTGGSGALKFRLLPVYTIMFLFVFA